MHFVEQREFGNALCSGADETMTNGAVLDVLRDRPMTKSGCFVAPRLRSVPEIPLCARFPPVGWLDHE
ncbi:MAG: hypothetical protein ABTQ32_11005 [Myxococcaceae bacterium]